jgi:hypothetical protein
MLRQGSGFVTITKGEKFRERYQWIHLIKYFLLKMFEEVGELEEKLLRQEMKKE